MTIAGKFNLLIAAVAIVASVLLVAFVGQRDFSYQRDALVLEASSLVASKPYLQLTFYFRDENEVSEVLEELLALSPAVKRAVLRDSQGGVIAERSRWWGDGGPQPRFREQRDGLSPLDTGLVTKIGGGVPEELKLLRSITLGEKTSFLSLPITSVVSPLVPDLKRADFAAMMAAPDLVRSIHVIGYVELGISSTMLWRQSMPTIALSTGVALTIVLIMALVARSLSRRITAPLGELAGVAYDIAMGKQPEPMQVRGSGEVSEIANVLNGIITGLHQYTQRMDTDKKMLSLKVNEQHEELSQRSEQLDQSSRSRQRARVGGEDVARHRTLSAWGASRPGRVRSRRGCPPG